MPVDFFISRTGADAQWGQWIGQVLIDAGYTVLLQDWDFRPGEDFVAKMDSAMRTSAHTIAVLSRAYDQALFTVPEWTNAIARDPTGRNAILVPVRVDDIVPEGILKTRIYIDLFGLGPEEARKRLLDGVSRERLKPAVVTFPGGAVTDRFPGALPPIWRTPSERNAVFTGRDLELDEIRQRFRSPDPPPLVLALVGLGGVGKTALAVEYAHRERDYYKAVWWIRAQHRETVAADLALLAERLDIAGENDDLMKRAEAARQWLAEHDRWLLIVDEADDPAIARFAIPAGGGGHVLLTSRRPTWRRQGAVIELTPLADASAADLLARRSGQPASTASLTLVRLLGGLPLAVELAGAFLEQQGVEPAEYLDRLRRSGGLPADDVAYRPPDYRLGLNAVWAESFRIIAAESAPGSDLLRLSAYLAPDDIPRPALARGARRLPPVLGSIAADPDRLADLVARPRAFSLVTTSGDGFSMHRLVQATLRDSLQPAEQKQWAGTAILWLDYVLPKQVADFRLWSRTGRLIGHALAAAGHGVAITVESQAVLKLLDRGATYLMNAGGQPAEIAAAREAAIRFGETLPEGPPAWLLNNHAEWLMRNHGEDQAQPLLERAVEVTRRQEGGNSAGLGVYWTNLGTLLQRRNDLDRARTCLVRAVAILDRLPRWADEKRATAHSILGQVLFSQGDRDAAAGHFAEAVRCYDSSLGPGSLDSITARTFLAQARGEDPRVIVAYHVTPASIHTEEGKLLARERAWQDDAEQLLRDAVRAGQPGAALELAFALTDQPGREDEADTILAEAAQTGDKEALYWHARESAEKIGVAAESEIRSSIAAGNVFSNYDLGLVLASDPARRGEAEDAFHIAIGAGYDTARNDLGLLLCEWVGREAEGEEMLADAGRRGQPRCFANLATHLISKGRREDAVAALRAAAEDGYLRAYGRLAYLLEDLGRYADALAAFQQGIDAGESPLETHLTDFRTRHPELTASPT